MPTDLVKQFIEHHGVKGQKWGVRRKDTSTNSSSGPRKLSSITSENTKHLTNDELRKIIERMNLDRQFSELTSAKTHAGRKYTKTLLENSGKTAVGVLVSAVATKAVKTVIK